MQRGVVKDRLEALVLGACHVGVDVDDDAADRLTDAGSERDRLVGVQREPLVARDPGDELVERPPARPRRARERQVVGIARVAHPERRGEPGQPPVEAERREVGQRGRGRGALRQVRRGQRPAEREAPSRRPRLHAPGALLPHRERDRVGAQPGERVRDAGAVAGLQEDAVHPAGGDRREEIPQIPAQHHGVAGVQRGVADDRAPRGEAVRGIVRGDPVEDLVQQPALDLLQPRLRGLDHPRQAAAPRRRPWGTRCTGPRDA
jgi:hypothetical protein